LPALARLQTGHEFVLYVSSRQTRITRDLPAGFAVRRIRFPRPSSVSRLVWEQTLLPSRLRRDGVAVLLAPADVAPLLSPWPVGVAMRNPAPYYGTQSRALLQRARLAVLRRLSRASSRRASHVYFVSEDSRERIGGALGAPRTKTSVIYHGLGRI